MALPEYTDELNERFLQNLTGRIGRREQERVGQAKSEAIARGMAGDPFEGSLVGQARAEADVAREGAEADFFYNLAGQQRGERLGREQRGYQIEDRNFAAAEAEKDRSFRERLARYGWYREQEEARAGRRGALFGKIGKVVGTGAGAFLGAGLTGSYKGAQLFGNLGGGLGEGAYDAFGNKNKYRDYA